MATTAPTPPTTTKSKPKLVGSQTWTVLLDGTPTEVRAEAVELTPEGLVFTINKHIVRAVAPGHWASLEIVPPPEPPEE